MNKLNINTLYQYSSLAIIVFLFLSIYGITQSELINTYDSLSIAITIDLLVTIPLIYLLLVRKTRIPNISVLLVFGIGIALGSLFIPVAHQGFFEAIRVWLLPVIELLVISLAVYKVKGVIKRINVYQKSEVDFYDALKLSLKESVPKFLVMPLVMELSVFYYGFMHWKKVKLKTNQFTYHKESGTIALLLGILLIISVETYVLHMLIVKWNVLIAWILSGISIYSGLQIFGFLKSTTKRPITIEKDRLILRYGIMAEANISLSNIVSIVVTSSDIEINEATRKLSFLGNLEGHNVILKLKDPEVLHGLYGIKRKFLNLAFHVDKRDEFIDQLNMVTQESTDIR